ncbi:12529_t:CDS:10 [Acaulospora morrowiae]|uniref:12529_t:CDS:1 n=1 Tax=Acaulospora morrowiae TaxID=94023 RepID=A0A9N9GGK1_9GLOM|nr:12529_t:CDS:10 [Acaulospora morrowiae]
MEEEVELNEEAELEEEVELNEEAELEEEVELNEEAKLEEEVELKEETELEEEVESEEEVELTEEGYKKKQVDLVLKHDALDNGVKKNNPQQSVFMLKSIANPKSVETMKDYINEPVQHKMEEASGANMEECVPKGIHVNSTDSQEVSSQSYVDATYSREVLPEPNTSTTTSHEGSSNVTNFLKSAPDSNVDFEAQETSQTLTSAKSLDSPLLEHESSLINNQDSTIDEESDTDDPTLDRMVNLLNSMITEAKESVETPVRGREKNLYKQFDQNKVADIDFSQINAALDEYEESYYDDDEEKFNKSLTEFTTFVDEMTMTDDTVNETMHNDHWDPDEGPLRCQNEQIEDLDYFSQQCRFLTRALIIPFLKFTHTFMSASFRKEEIGTIRSLVYIIYWTFLFTLGVLVLDSWLCEIAGRQVIRLLIRLGQLSFQNRHSYDVISKAAIYPTPGLPAEYRKNMAGFNEFGSSNSFYDQIDSEVSIFDSHHYQLRIMTSNSGNHQIDALIKETHENSNSLQNILEWMPFQFFRNIEFLAQGGFARIALASYDDHYEKSAKKRVLPEKIVLKFVRNSCEVDKRLIDEVRMHHKCMLYSPNIIPFYGLTQDPNSLDYAMVIKHATHGDLRDFLHDRFITQTWKEKIKILLDLAHTLRSIHQLNLIHRDFHCKNILVDDETCSVFVSDFGLCTDVKSSAGDESFLFISSQSMPIILNVSIIEMVMKICENWDATRMGGMSWFLMQESKSVVAEEMSETFPDDRTKKQESQPVTGPDLKPSYKQADDANSSIDLIDNEVANYPSMPPSPQSLPDSPSPGSVSKPLQKPHQLKPLLRRQRQSSSHNDAISPLVEVKKLEEAPTSPQRPSGPKRKGRRNVEIKHKALFILLLIMLLKYYVLDNRNFIDARYKTQVYQFTINDILNNLDIQ